MNWRDNYEKAKQTLRMAQHKVIPAIQWASRAEKEVWDTGVMEGPMDQTNRKEIEQQRMLVRDLTLNARQSMRRAKLDIQSALYALENLKLAREIADKADE